MNKNNKIIGNLGELKIEEYLIKRGYTICDRNFTIRGGEIDIIAQFDKTYAFVEVKHRTIMPNFSFSSIITKRKQESVIYTARYYLAKKKISCYDYIIRFDVALVCNDDIQYIENAFAIADNS